MNACTVLNELNGKLLAKIQETDELEQGIMKAEDIECEINKKSALISAFILSHEGAKYIQKPYKLVYHLQVHSYSKSVHPMLMRFKLVYFNRKPLHRKPVHHNPKHLQQSREYTTKPLLEC